MSRVLPNTESRIDQTLTVYDRCDLCRTRKVACVVDDGATACLVCRRRGLDCTFQSQPGIKSRPGYQPTRTRSQDQEHSALRFRFLGQQGTNQLPSDPSSHWFDQAMTIKGHTCFYAGMSGDQGSDLLRHLSYNEQNIFGNASWSAWRVHPRIHDPVYFTVSNVPSIHSTAVIQEDD